MCHLAKCKDNKPINKNITQSKIFKSKSVSADLKTSPDCIPLFTEPCPPTNVVVNASCEEHSALVLWSPSPVAETYHVVATGDNGHVHTCNTTSNNCSVSELHCGQQYTVFVKASHENCSSKASENVTITTGICPSPQKTWRIPVHVHTLTQHD